MNLACILAAGVLAQVPPGTDAEPDSTEASVSGAESGPYPWHARTPDASRPRYLTVGGSVGVQSNTAAFSMARLAFSIGQIFPERGLGWDLSLGVDVPPFVVASDEAACGDDGCETYRGLVGGTVGARFRAAPFRNGHWPHLVIPLQVDFLCCGEAEGGQAAGERFHTSWLASGVGFGYRRFKGDTFFWGADLLALGGVILDGTVRSAWHPFGRAWLGGSLSLYLGRAF